MGLSASPIPLTKYDPSTDTASIVYEIPEGIKATSWLAPYIGTSLNSQVVFNRSGLQQSLSALERAETVAALAAVIAATTTEIALATPGCINASVAAAGTTQGGATALASDINVVASGTGGVKLPAISPLDAFSVTNSTGANINLYPNTGDYINGAAVNVAYVIAPGQRVTVYGKSSAVANTATGVWYIAS